MTRIAFIGLGNMGGGMAANQARAGHEVVAFDLSAAALERAVAAGCRAAGSVIEAVAEAEVVITMLPAGPHVRDVYGAQILGHAPTTALLIDCSTIDVESARAVALLARSAGYRFADAPVSGGTAAAEAGTLAFMVGCDEADFADIESALVPMSRVTIRAGDHGAGQAAKICNNMVLGITMIGVCEAFALAEKLGLEADRFFDIASRSSGQCWSLSNYSPWPGQVPTAPSSTIWQVALPWMPILCSRPPQNTALRSPKLPSSRTKNLGTTNKLMPLLPAGASGKRANTKCTMLLTMSCSPALMKILLPVMQ